MKIQIRRKRKHHPDRLLSPTHKDQFWVWTLCDNFTPSWRYLTLKFPFLGPFRSLEGTRALAFEKIKKIILGIKIDWWMILRCLFL